jgi:hypothetical protein
LGQALIVSSSGNRSALALVPGFQFVCVDLGAARLLSLSNIYRGHLTTTHPFGFIRMLISSSGYVRRQVQFSAAPLLPLLEIVL